MARKKRKVTFKIQKPVKKLEKSYFDFLQVAEKLVLTKVAHTRNSRRAGLRRALKRRGEDALFAAASPGAAR